MTPEEKWERIKNPKSIEDWRLSLTVSEMLTFPEGVVLIKELERQREPDELTQRVLSQFGEAVRGAIEKTAYDVLSKDAEGD